MSERKHDGKIDDLFCPYCSAEQDDEEVYYNGEHEYQCCLCYKLFDVKTTVTISFITKKLEEVENE